MRLAELQYTIHFRAEGRSVRNDEYACAWMLIQPSENRRIGSCGFTAHSRILIAFLKKLITRA